MNRRTVNFGLIVIVGLSLFFVFKNRYGRLRDTAEMTQQLTSSVPLSGSTMSLRSVLNKMTSGQQTSQDESAFRSNRETVRAHSKQTFSESEVRLAGKFFAEVISDPKINELYTKTQKYMGPSVAGQGAARWMTLGVIFSSADGYGETLHMALKDANQDPGLVLSQIRENLGSIRRDPFIYQMTMNMVYQLDLDVEKRSEYYGEELKYQLSTLAGEPKDSYWVSMVGLLFAKQAGASGQYLAGYIRDGIANSKGDSKYLNELKTMAKFHFPGIDL